MSSRLASFADEIERYLGIKRDPDESREDEGIFSARKRGGFGQSKYSEPEPGRSIAGRNIDRRRKVGSGQSVGSSDVGATRRTHVSGSLSTSQNAQAIAVFNTVVAAEREDDDLLRVGGGAREGANVPLASYAFMAPVRVAARAAYAAGAQEAVFKVISSTPTKVRAAALLEYVGTREGEDGEKHDIAVYTDDGHILDTAQVRKEFLDGFAENFEAVLQNTNFIEVEFVLQHPVQDDELPDALNQAFGRKPFVYARSEQTVKAFALTDNKAAAISKVLSIGRDRSRSQIVEKMEGEFTSAFARFNIAASAEVVAAVGDERKAAYFLQKFIRNNRGAKHASGDSLKTAGNPARAAAKVFDSWRKDMAGTAQRRNAYHLLFSAKAGTDPNAIMLSARAVLEEKAHGHQYAFAHHGDTDHVHVHVMVQAVSNLGERLNFRKADLYEWREAFAEQARENGVAMVATRRQEHAKPRPYTKEHAGALMRAQQDTAYSVSSATENRVLDKRSGMIDPETARRDGVMIAEAWEQTARIMAAANIERSFVANVESFVDNVVRFVPKEHRPQTRTALADLDMKPAAKLLDAMETAVTAREMSVLTRMIGETLDTLYERVRVSDQARFNEIRAELFEVLNARHTKLEQELHDHDGESDHGDDGKSDNLRERELSEAQQSVDEVQTSDAAVKKHQEKKLVGKKHSEAISARRQRERDRDKGR